MWLIYRLELLVFYRKARDAFPNSGFRYEGRFRYPSHSSAYPTSFVLKRVDTLLETVQRDLAALHTEETLHHEGNHSHLLVNHFERDPHLRAAAIRAHGTRCQGCGFSFGDTYGPYTLSRSIISALSPAMGAR